MRWRRAVTAIGTAVVLVTTSACASDPAEPTLYPPTGGGTTIASSTLTGHVVSVYFSPYPEGSVVARFATTPSSSVGSPIDVTKGFAAFVARLGWPLPEPLAQPRSCPRGGKNYTVRVELDSGQAQSYGPCTRPTLVEEAAALLGTGYP